MTFTTKITRVPKKKIIILSVIVLLLIISLIIKLVTLNNFNRFSDSPISEHFSVTNDSFVYLTVDLAADKQSGLLNIKANNPFLKPISAFEFYIQFDPHIINFATNPNDELADSEIQLDPQLSGWTSIAKHIINDQIRIAYFCNSLNSEIPCQSFHQPDLSILSIPFYISSTQPPVNQINFKFINNPNKGHTNKLIDNNSQTIETTKDLSIQL